MAEKSTLRIKANDKVGKNMCNLFINDGLMLLIQSPSKNGEEANNTFKNITC